MVLLTPEEQAIQVIKSTAAHGGGYVSGGGQAWKVAPNVSSPTNSFVTTKEGIIPAEDVKLYEKPDTRSGNYVKTPDTNTRTPVSKGVADLLARNNAAAQSVALTGSTIPSSEITYTVEKGTYPTQNYTPSTINSFFLGRKVIDYQKENFFRTQALTINQRPLDYLLYSIFYDPFAYRESIAASSVRLAGGTEAQALEAAFQSGLVSFYKEAAYNPNLFIAEAALSGAMYGIGGAGFINPSITKLGDIIFKGSMAIKTLEFMESPNIEKGLGLIVGAGTYATIGLASGLRWKDVSNLKVNDLETAESLITPKGFNLEAGSDIAKTSAAKQLTFFGRELPVYQFRYSESFGEFAMVGKKDLGYSISHAQGVDITKTGFYSTMFNIEHYSYDFPITSAESLQTSQPFILASKIGKGVNFIDYNDKEYQKVYGISRGYSVYSDKIITGKIGYALVSRSESTLLNKEPVKFMGMDYDINQIKDLFFGNIYSFKGENIKLIGTISGRADITSYAPTLSFASGGGGGSFSLTKPDMTSSLSGLGGGFGSSILQTWKEHSFIAGTDENIAKTAAITSTSQWKPFYPKQPRYKEMVDVNYVYPSGEKNAVTETTKSIQSQVLGSRQNQLEVFNQSLSNKQQQEMQNKINVSLGTATALSYAQTVESKQGLQQQLQLMLGTRLSSKLEVFNRYQFLYKEKFSFWEDEDNKTGFDLRGKKNIFSIGKRLIYGKEKVKIEPKSDWLSRIQSEAQYGKATNVPNKPKYKRAFLKEFMSPMGLFAGRMPTQEMIKELKIKI
jgi:hypothetical protein